MNPRMIEEIYGFEARVQLSFGSYMKIASFLAVFFSLVITIFLRSTVVTHTEPAADASILNLWMFGYFLLGFFAAGVAGSLISYPIYKTWCNHLKGQRMTGRFAVQIDSSNKQMQPTPNNGSAD